MTTYRSLTVAGALATIVMAAFVATQLYAQDAPEVRADLRNAAAAEVRDAQGIVLLKGEFVAVDEDDDDVERKAALKATPSSGGASGEAEVEFPKTGVVEQEVEFSAKGLTRGAKYSFVIDGKVIGTAPSRNDGSIELELKIKLPAGVR